VGSLRARRGGNFADNQLDYRFDAFARTTLLYHLKTKNEINFAFIMKNNINKLRNSQGQGLLTN
jgi:hypothetical protein